jgi:hypothetical protein
MRLSEIAVFCDGLRSCYAALQADIISFMQLMQSLDEPSDGEAV